MTRTQGALAGAWYASTSSDCGSPKVFAFVRASAPRAMKRTSLADNRVSAIDADAIREDHKHMGQKRATQRPLVN